MVSIFLPLAIILVSFLSLVVWSRHSDRFPLKTVEIRSPLHLVEEAEIQASVLPFFDKGFFWLDVRRNGKVQAAR